MPCAGGRRPRRARVWDRGAGAARSPSECRCTGPRGRRGWGATARPGPARQRARLRARLRGNIDALAACGQALCDLARRDAPRHRAGGAAAAEASGGVALVPLLAGVRAAAGEAATQAGRRGCGGGHVPGRLSSDLGGVVRPGGAGARDRHPRHVPGGGALWGALLDG